MNMKKTYCFILGALLFTSLHITRCLAAEKKEGIDIDSQRWYQVELIIFKQPPTDNAAQEKWRQDIALAYPPNWVELKSAAGATTKPYYTLPTSKHQMTGQAKQLDRNPHYRILFHQAWRQPVIELDKAPALLIQSGETYDGHHELEGSIILSVSRYLHLHTNLWLSRFKANYGQDYGNWPELPAHPRSRANDTNTRSPNTGQQDLWGSAENQTGKYDNIISQPYVVDQIVTFRQKRKMRSGELHYVDHPLLGLLIKVTSYKPSAEQ